MLDYEGFKKKASELVGIDLELYKSQQMDRRIISLMTFWGLSSYDDYYEALVSSSDRLAQFVNKLTINVSEFFRNPERFEALQDKILPGLLSARPFLRIWSAGCSNGSEPYSVALLLRKLTPGVEHYILGTDIDREILRRAAEGVYSPNEIRNVPAEDLENYFTCDGKNYCLNREIRESVHFHPQDLLNDTFETGFDMIICRNVVIYFTEQAKDDLYRRLRESLRDNGVLFVGGTEPLLNCRQIGFEADATGFYRKTEIAADAVLYWEQLAAARETRRKENK